MRSHPRSAILVAIALFASAASLACDGGKATPNIILIIGDDHGWTDFGFMGHPIVKTPHLDALAAEGTRFSNGFATASSCRASLMSLLTGLHPLQRDTRIETLERRGTRENKQAWIQDAVTLPRLLAERGFASFQGGKYWEGSYRDGGFTHGTKTALDSDPVDPVGWLRAQSGGDGLELGRSTMQPLWDFLEANRRGPFFVWFAPKLPHVPFDAPESYEAAYAGLELSPRAAKYYANITRFDERVGEVVAYLERTGLRDRTLIVYLADNGYQQERDASPSSKALGGPKGKWSLYEMGFRTPILFSWPGRIPRGRVLNQLVSAVDVFATLVDFAGLEPAADRAGHSLRPLLTGEGGFERTRVIGSAKRLRPPPGSQASAAGGLTRPERAYFLRSDTWRYLWYLDSEEYPDRKAHELYRIAADPMETRDLAAENPELTAQFRDEILAWVEEMKQPFQ